MRITELEYLQALEVVKLYKKQVTLEVKSIEISNSLDINYMSAKKGDYIIFKKVSKCRKDIILNEKYLIHNVKIAYYSPMYRCIVLKIENKTRYFHFDNDLSPTNEAEFIRL